MRVPPVLLSIWRTWMRISHAIGLVMSRIILTVLWIVVFGVYAIPSYAMRLFKGKDEHDGRWVSPPEEESNLEYSF